MIVRDCINRVFNEFLYPAGVYRPAFDTLSANITTTTATSMTLTGLQSYVPQAVLEFDDDSMETVLTTAAESDTTIAINERGYGETTAATHIAGIKVFINPKFQRQTVFNAISSVVQSLYGMGLFYATSETDVTISTSTIHALPSGALDIIDVVIDETGDERVMKDGVEYVFFPHYSPPKVRFKTNRGDTCDIFYAKDFVAPTLLTDDLTTNCLVPASLANYIPMAVAGYLLIGKELPNFMVEDLKRKLAAEGAQPGAAVNTGFLLMDVFEKVYVARELRKLNKRNPPRVRKVF